MKTTIGLDISSTKIGVAVLIDGIIFDLYGITFKSEDDLFVRVGQFKEFIVEEVFSRYPDANIVYVEDYLRQTVPGKTSAQSLFKLAIMNGICCYIMKIELKKDVKTINVATARKTVIGTIPHERNNRTVKEYAFDFVMQNNQEIKKVIDEFKGEKKKYPPIVYDLVDAYVIARAGFLQETEKEKEN